ncbi:MAG: HD domain-containing protein [Lachnospiraceae bacterium]|nr:HD domain-containing protein [Lachnospiraceae bacterium]
MKKKDENNNSDRKGLLKNTGQKEMPKFVLIFFLVLYLIATVLLTIVSSTKPGTGIIIGHGMIPYASLTGVFSSIANICIIFMVVFFYKRGFIISVVILALQFPVFIIKMVSDGNMVSIPGLFSTLVTIISISLIYSRNIKIEKFQSKELENLRSQQKFSQRLFEQTATALVNAIDAKDTYSRGHSIRVAEYSEKIARMMNKDEDECNKIYYAALLHDVGKIGIPSSIINKKGRLTDEEYDLIKQHPVMGNQILSSISEYPYLSIGAHYHHERYDGKGYPERLKGDDIPEIARIISVADAYDAMSSNRSYRDAIPQQLVREEIVKGAGTQFDPEIAKVMQRLIDLDVEYKMKERRSIGELAGRNKLECKEARSEIADGIIVIPFITKIHMKVTPDKSTAAQNKGASMIIFDSLDGRVHDEERTIKDLYYTEFCELWMDGRTVTGAARRIQTNIMEHDPSKKKHNPNAGYSEYDIEAVKCRDHVQIRIDDGSRMIEVIIALPDSSRYAYLGITGEHCLIDDISVVKEHKWVPKDYIPRIAEKISYLSGPEGNIPSVQVDGHRTEFTKGILIKDKLDISFHTMSLPTARLIWHCPYMVFFYSKDGNMYGDGYFEYATVRLDGEGEDVRDFVETRTEVSRNDAFEGWDVWKAKNKQGIDCELHIERKGRTITLSTENLGVVVKSTTTILDGRDNIYFSLTGDQCALTNINVK